ncbi:MAG: hypothetical protein AAFX85_07805, partial [Pseudomonadota bacterium]
MMTTLSPTVARRGGRFPASAAAALLMTFGAAMPLAAAPSLEAFATLGTLRQIELSPDGSWVAYLYPAQGRLAVVAHPVKDATNPTVLPLSPESYVKWFRWGNNERLVVSYGFTQTARRFGNRQLLGGKDLEQSRLFSFKRDGSDSKRPV